MMATLRRSGFATSARPGTDGSFSTDEDISPVYRGTLLLTAWGPSLDQRGPTIFQLRSAILGSIVAVFTVRPGLHSRIPVHITSSPVILLRQTMSTLPSPVKSATEWMSQSTPMISVVSSRAVPSRYQSLLNPDEGFRHTRSAFASPSTLRTAAVRYSDESAGGGCSIGPVWPLGTRE